MEPEPHHQQEQQVKDWQHSQSVENQSPARNNDNDNDDDHDVSPRKETPKPIVSNKQKNQQQQSPSSATRNNKIPIHHRHNTTDDSIPNPNFFLLSSENQNQQQRIASFTPSPSAFTHHHQNSSNITGSGNFFKQHVSFVNDQPSDPDFVPNPSWFQEHGHQEFRHLNSSPGSTKIDENHQRMLMKARQHHQQQQQKEDKDRKSPLRKESYYTSSSPTSRRRPLTRPTTTSINDENDQENYPDSSAFSLREAFHREHGSSSSSPSRTTRTSRSQKTSESLQNSLNELRRKQIIRTALEEGRIVTDEEQNDHDTTTADYWVSPSQQEQSERRIRSSRTLSPPSSTSGRKNHRRPTMSVIDDQSQEDAPPSVVEKLKAFTSAEEFGEELVIALGKDLFQSLVVGFWVLLRRFGNWIYRLGYFMLFGIALSSKNSSDDPTDIDHTRMENQKNQKHEKNQQQQQGFPSPFPSFYRDAFFSTWSPHELLEPRDLPMTNAFRPTKSTFPQGISSPQQAAEMLRPTPAPPFWWIGMMEISGRHFIESQWSQSFVENIYLPAAQEARAMWVIHEDEVMRGSDLVASVARKGVAFSSTSIGDDEDDRVLNEDDDPYRYRVSQGGPFRTL